MIFDNSCLRSSSMTERVLVSVVVGARMTDGVRDSSIFEDSVGHERHLDAAADLLTALTGDTEVANRGKCKRMSTLIRL